MLKAGLAEPDKSEYASSVFFAFKRDGSLQFCVNYCRLDAITVQDINLVLRMGKCIDSLEQTKIFFEARRQFRARENGGGQD